MNGWFPRSARVDRKIGRFCGGDAHGKSYRHGTQAFLAVGERRSCGGHMPARTEASDRLAATTKPMFDAFEVVAYISLAIGYAVMVAIWMEWL